MTIPHGAMTYVQAFGSRPTTVPIIQNRDPASTDYKYVQGQFWINNSSGSMFALTQFSTTNGIVSASWDLLSSGSGNVASLTTDDSTVVLPTDANINVFGTANQITTSGSNSPGTVTLSVPSSFIAPGSIAATTTITAGTGLTVSAGTSSLKALTQVGTATINASGSAVTTIGTGGTGAVNIGNATGNTAITGSLTASTTLTATSGAITATLGDFVATNGGLQLQTLGNKISIKAGTTGFAGTGTLSSGTVTINNTNIATGDYIFLTRIAANGSTTFGVLSYTISNAASFTVTSLILGTPGSTQTADTSTFAYFIVRPL